MNAIEWKDVLFGFEKHTVLQPSRFAIAKGSLVGIMGPNGGGKTTLLKLLMGFLKPVKGEIKILGTPAAERKQKIGYVPQFNRTDREFPITVEEVVDLGCFCKPEHPVDWIEHLGLSSYRKKRFGDLSGGLMQRTLLARALSSDPDILLLDEPTANIDPPSAMAILDLLDSLKGKKTILLVTHDVKTIVERVEQILSVQGRIKSYLPGEICEHFAMGLYHTPLLDSGHWKQP